jgi:hypothetical protein
MSSKKRVAMARNKKRTVRIEPAAVVEVNVTHSSGRGIAFNKWLKPVITSAFVIFVILEIIRPIQRYAFESLKPVLVAHWTPGNGYTGVTSMYSYRDNLYLLNSQTGVMLEYGLLTGKFLQKYDIPSGFYSMAMLSNGDMLALSAGNTLIRYPAGSDKPLPAVVLAGGVNLASIAVDSKDELLALDGEKNTVIKYDAKLNRICEFGEGTLKGARKVFAGPKDSVYVLDFEPKAGLYVKIFSKNNRFVRKFEVMEPARMSGLEGLAVTASGNVYVNDYGGNNVEYFSADGRPIANFNSLSDDITMIKYPSTLCNCINGELVISSLEVFVTNGIKM